MSPEKRDKVVGNAYFPKRYCHNLEGKMDDESDGLEAAARGIGGARIVTGPKFGCVHHEPK